MSTEQKNLINQIELDYSNRGFIYLKNQIKENGEYEIFITDREWNNDLNKYIFYKFPFKISNQSLAKNNRIALIKNKKNGKELRLRIKRIFFPKIIKGPGYGAQGYAVTVEKN